MRYSFRCLIASGCPIAFYLILAVSGGAGLAAEGARSSDTEAPDREAVLRESHGRFAALELQVSAGGALRNVEPLPDPVLRFADPTRANDQGTLWLWGRAGRPVAVLELYRNDARDWIYVMNNLSGENLTARREEGPWWEPRESTLRFAPLPDAPVPSRNPAARRTQMRALARRFSAHEFWDPDNSRYELRLLTQPLYRYDDAERGVRDGALFAFANGTNPEVLLFLEACEAEQSADAWRFGAARMGHAEMHLLYDGREVWQVPRVNPSQRTEPYWLFYEPVPPPR